MSFAALPAWAVGALLALAALAVVGLYLLRRAPRLQPVSSVAFWLEAMQRARPRLLAARRVPLASLLLSLAVALLLVVELGGPRFGEGVRGTTVIVVSAGQSMGAETAGRTRLDRALDETRRWFDRATAGGEAAVVRAGVRPRVLVPLTSDEGELGRALATLALDDGPADLDGALRLADDIVQARGGAGQILVIADAAPAWTARTPTVQIPVGGPGDSLAVTRLIARRDPRAAGEYALRAEVRSASSRRARARLVVRDREVVIVDQALELGPGEVREISGQGFSSAQAELTARLEDVEIAGSADALAADDVAHAVVAPLDPIRALVVTGGNPWLEAVLAAHPAIEARVIRPEALPSLSPGDLAAEDVIVLDGLPLDAARGHRAVVAFAPVSSAALTVGEPLGSPRPTATLSSHPALGGVRLEGTRLSRARALDPGPGDRALLRSAGHVLGLAREREGARLLALSFDLAGTELVERPTFPLLVHHALSWVVARDRALPLPHRPGDPLAAAPGSTVLGPDEGPLPVLGGAVHDTARAGLYHLGERAFAVGGAEGSGPAAGAAPQAGSVDGRLLPPLSVLVAVLLLLVMAAEWALLHRGRLA